MTMLAPTQLYDLRTRYLEVLLEEARANPSAELYDRIERLLELTVPEPLVFESISDALAAMRPWRPAPVNLIDQPADKSEDSPPAVEVEAESEGLDISEDTEEAPPPSSAHVERGTSGGRAGGSRPRSIRERALYWEPDGAGRLSPEEVDKIREGLKAAGAHEILDLPITDKTPDTAGDDDAWGDFGAPADTRLDAAFGAEGDVESAQELESDDEELQDGEGIMRARGVAVDPASLAPLVGRDDTPERLVRVAPCTRCANGQFARDPLEPNDPTAFACIACGHRPRLSREDAFALEQELRKPGKLRQREASHGGMRL